MAKLLVGRWAFTKQAAPMPESPAPTRSTSTCCGCGPPRCAMSAAPDRSEAASVLDGMGLNPDGGGHAREALRERPWVGWKLPVQDLGFIQQQVCGILP